METDNAVSCFADNPTSLIAHTSASLDVHQHDQGLFPYFMYTFLLVQNVFEKLPTNFQLLRLCLGLFHISFLKTQVYTFMFISKQKILPYTFPTLCCKVWNS